MSKESRRQKIKWLEHVLWVLGTWTALGLALVIIAVGSGLANPLLRRILIERLETLTGAKVEIRTVSVGWFSLDAAVKGLVIHGTEPQRHGTAVERGTGQSWIANRFVLGTTRFAEGTGCAGSASTPAG